MGVFSSCVPKKLQIKSNKKKWSPNRDSLSLWQVRHCIFLLDSVISELLYTDQIIFRHALTRKIAGLGGSVGCAVRLETRRSRFQPRRGRQHSFVEIDHEIFSTVILSLPLIQEGQLSVSGERICTILVNRLED